MKFTCAQREFNSHLSFVSRAISSRLSHPVLANVLVVADSDKQQVSLTGFDLSLGIQTTFNAQVEDGGSLTLPAKLLTDIVSKLPDGDVSLDEEEDYSIAIISASGRYQVRGMGAEEYPDLPTIEGDDVVSLPIASLIEGLDGTLFSVSTDETKQVLTGVHITANEDGLELAGCDGHRLAVVQSASNSETSFEVTVPAKALRELDRMVKTSKEDAIAMRFDQGQLVFEWENQRLTSRLLEGQYPNYRQLIPRQFSRQMTVERRSLMDSLERIAVLADQQKGIVRMSLDTTEQKLTLSVEAQDVGSGKEEIGATIAGESLNIAFNVKYILEALKAIDAIEVIMQLNTATSPVILTPLGGAKMTCLIMPVALRG